MTKKTEKAKGDYLYLGSLAAVVLFGLVMLSSVSSAIAYNRFGDNYYYLKHQVFFGVLPGLAVFYVLSKIDYRLWRKLALLALVTAIGLLVAVFIPGIGFSYGGATRWIHVGFFTFQAAEVVKLAFLIYLASWMERRGEHGVSNFSSGMVPFVSVLGLIMGLILKQPDMGTMMIIVLSSLAVYFVAGGYWKHIVTLFIAGMAGIALLIKMAPYRAARFTVFLNPELDPQGIGYHVNQALLAVGSGGLLGLGLGLSRQKHLYLPEVIGDSVFAIVAEELGFVITSLMITLFALLVYRGLTAGQRAPDLFGKYLATGISAWIAFQTIINIGAMLSIMPLTGLPLPFVSYGSTSTIVLLAACGIVFNISKHAVTKQAVRRWS